MKCVFICLIPIYIITIKELSGESITNNSSNLANRRQQDLIEGSMDRRADPCEDFYQYACGKWGNFNPEAGDKYYETMSLIDYKANQEIARFFNRSNLEDEPKFIKTALKFLTSCNNLNEEFQTVRYLNLLKEVENMKFPPLGRSRPKREKYDWLVMLAKMRIYGMNGILIQEEVIQRNEDPSKFIMFLYKPDVDDDFTSLTKDNLEEIIESLEETTNTFKLWREIEEFEYDLKNILQNYANSKEDYDEDWPLKKVKNMPLPWLKNYIEILVNQTEFNPNMEVYLQDVPYFRALDKLIKRHSQRFLCKYLQIRFLWHLHRQRPSEDCVRYARKFLPTAMYWLYEQLHPELQLEFPKIIELFDDIIYNFNKTLLKNEYGFNKTMVNYLLAKIKSMQLKLNDIPRIDTVQTLEKFYDNLDIKIDDFYANHLKLLKFNFMVKHNQAINNTTQQMDFLLEGSDTGESSAPNFIQKINTLVVPLTILQQPIYQPDSDNVYKYSSLGFLLAHTMFDGFDSSGLEIDYKGIRVDQRYEDILTNPLFNTRFSCVLETKPSQRENKIADINALSYAYQMFNNSRTDGMDVSWSKLFFLNFAQYFCGTLNSGEFVFQETSDRDRLTDALTNFYEFSKVFQCDSSQQMYPHRMCNTEGK